MHSLEHLDAFCVASVKGFQAATGVADGIFCQPDAHGVRDLGGDAADEIVFAFGATTGGARGFVGGFERSDELSDVGRIVLHVGVDQYDVLASSRLNAGFECAGLALILCEADDAQSGICFFEADQDGVGTVGGVIVGADDFVRATELLQFRVRFFDEILNTLFFIENGCDEGDVDGGIGHEKRG